jgi:hypothetical protein
MKLRESKIKQGLQVRNHREAMLQADYLLVRDCLKIEEIAGPGNRLEA